MRLFLAILAVVVLAAPTWAVATTDTVTITATLDNLPAGGYYMLTGQSAFIQNRPSGWTTGGQLDNVVSPGAVIIFNEVFPPPTLSEYETFAYLGLVETRDINDLVLDLSLVVAFQPNVAVGQLIQSLVGSYTEAQLVTAMSTSFDSPEFLDMANNQVRLNASSIGAIAVPPISQLGDTLDLIAFTGGVGGDEGAKIGTIGVSVVPEPASLALAAAGALALIRRRRH